MFTAPTFPDDFNLADYFLFDRLAEGLGAKDAILFGERRYSYATVAARVHALAGFFAGFPDNFAQITWFAGDRGLPFGWMIDMWLGAILATLVAGALYKD